MRLGEASGAALAADQGRILSGGDPRFSLSPVEAWRKLTFAKLKGDISDRLQHGAIELGLVGDFDEDTAIALVGKTFGALPEREPAFGAYAEQRSRPFTADRSRHVLRHTGAKDQALAMFVWPTRDGEDPAAALQLQMLERVMRIEITDTLREKLGKAYSPGASSSTSRTWRNFGTFSVTASVDVKELPATRAAIRETIAALRDAPVSEDVMLRAREPALEGIDNILKTNAGWLTFVDRAQTEPDRIDRYLGAKDLLKAITPAQIQALARQYLKDAAAVEFSVLPEGIDDPVTTQPKP